MNSELNADGRQLTAPGASAIPFGDPMAINELFATWMPRLYRAALRILRNPEDSEDAVQDALLSAYQNLEQFEGRAKFSTWMYSILLNTVRARLRKRRAQPESCSIEPEAGQEAERAFTVELIDLGPDPEQACVREEMCGVLADSFQRLPAVYQSVIWLCEVEELGQQEAAEHLGLPLGTVKCQLHRARRLLSERVRRASVFPTHVYRHIPGSGSPISGITAVVVAS